MTFSWSHGTAAVSRQRFFYILCCLCGLVLLTLAGCRSSADDASRMGPPHLILIDCRSGEGRIIADQEINTSASSLQLSAPALPLTAAKP